MSTGARSPYPSGTNEQCAPLRVLVANPGADLFGSDRMAVETASALAGQGMAVIATTPTDGALVERLQANGARCMVCRTSVLRKSILSPGGMMRFSRDIFASVLPGLRLLGRTAPDVVFVNTIISPLWIVLAKIRGIPVVCHVHEAEDKLPWVGQLLLNIPLLLSDRIIANSNFTAEHLFTVLPMLRKRTTVVYNSVGSPLSCSPPRGELSGPVRLVFVGRLSPRKGPHVAIEAVGLLRSKDIQVDLDIVGSVFPGYEWYQEKLARQVSDLGLSEAVRFHGFQLGVYDFLASSDIAVIPSTLAEPFGNTAVEAILASRPVIASDLGGLPEAVNGFRSAVLVQPESPEALAEAVQGIVNDWWEYRTAAIRGADTARARYGARSYRASVCGVVRDVIQSRPRRRGLRRRPGSRVPTWVQSSDIVTTP